jgi:hypothetical protein
LAASLFVVPENFGRQELALTKATLVPRREIFIIAISARLMWKQIWAIFSAIVRLQSAPICWTSAGDTHRISLLTYSAKLSPYLN